MNGNSGHGIVDHQLPPGAAPRHRRHVVTDPTPPPAPATWVTGVLLDRQGLPESITLSMSNELAREFMAQTADHAADYNRPVGDVLRLTHAKLNDALNAARTDLHMAEPVTCVTLVLVAADAAALCQYTNMITGYPHEQYSAVHLLAKIIDDTVFDRFYANGYDDVITLEQLVGTDD